MNLLETFYHLKFLLLCHLQTILTFIDPVIYPYFLSVPITFHTAVSSSVCQIENLQEQLRDKDKQLGNLKDRVKSLQTDSSNTDTALATLEEALSEKVGNKYS